MKTVEQTRRELFEAEYCRRNGCKIDHMQKDGNHYQRDSAQIAWGWFNAALDAVVIALPPPYPSVFHGAEDFADGIESCREFINENNNLGLKIR